MTTKRSRMFDAAFPDGLLSLEGWPFECRGRTWMAHRGRPRDRHPTITVWFVSDEETGFSCGGTDGRVVAGTRNGVKREAIKFLSQFTDESLARFVQSAKDRRPTNRITE